MAIDFLAGSEDTFTDTAGASSASFSDTYDSLSSGADRVLVVGAGLIRDAGSSAFCTVSSATYNGVSMEIEQVASQGTGANSPDTSILTLINPATGSNTLVLNFTDSNAHDSWSIVVGVYTDGNQTDAVPSGETDEDTAANGITLSSLSVTTGEANQHIVMVLTERNGLQAWIPDGSGVKRAEADSGNNSSQDNRTALIDYAAPTAQAYTDNATLDPANNARIAGVMIALKQAGVGPVANPKNPLGHPLKGPFAGPVSLAA